MVCFYPWLIISLQETNIQGDFLNWFTIRIPTFTIRFTSLIFYLASGKNHHIIFQKQQGCAK